MLNVFLSEPVPYFTWLVYVRCIGSCVFLFSCSLKGVCGTRMLGVMGMSPT